MSECVPRLTHLRQRGCRAATETWVAWPWRGVVESGRAAVAAASEHCACEAAHTWNLANTSLQLCQTLTRHTHTRTPHTPDNTHYKLTTTVGPQPSTTSKLNTYQREMHSTTTCHGTSTFSKPPPTTSTIHRRRPSTQYFQEPRCTCPVFTLKHTQTTTNSVLFCTKHQLYQIPQLDNDTT